VTWYDDSGDSPMPGVARSVVTDDYRQTPRKTNLVGNRCYRFTESVRLIAKANEHDQFRITPTKLHAG